MNAGDFAPKKMKNEKDMILFVGDHSCFSDIYLRLISEEFSHFQIACERRIEDAERRIEVETANVSLVIICCRFGPDALAALKRIVTARPDVGPVLAYAAMSEVRDVLQSSYKHAPLERLSFLPMRAKIDAVISILHLLISGECHVSNDVVNFLLEERGAPDAPTPQGCPAGGLAACPVRNPVGCQADIGVLTSRELEVLALLSEGAPNKLIAKELSLSPSTVKLHIHHIITKLDVRNRTEAAVAYLGSRLTTQRDPVS